MCQISKEEIKRVLDRLLDKLENEDLSTIAINSDTYLQIPTEVWGNINSPATPSVESLIDDVENLKELASDDDRETTYVDFDRTASLLRYISEEFNPADEI